MAWAIASPSFYERSLLALEQEAVVDCMNHVVSAHILWLLGVGVKGYSNWVCLGAFKWIRCLRMRVDWGEGW